MVEIRGLGTFDKVSKVVEDILNEDITALDKRLSKRWNLDKRIRISEMFVLPPLEIAFIAKAFASVKWLVDNGANLNVENNSGFALAARYGDEGIIRYLVDNGAKVIPDFINLYDCAFEQAMHGDNLSVLPLIQSLGYTVEKYGGNAFMSAIINNEKRAIAFFMENDVDVNFIPEAGMFRSRKTSPLCFAARFADLDLCNALVTKGADVIFAEDGTMRPYQIALERGDLEMADFFKSLEPPAFHDIQSKIQELKPYRLPDTLLYYLQGDNLRLNFDKKAASGGCEYIDFFSFADVMPIKIGRAKMLRLSRAVENYDGSVHIVWNPKEKMIAWYDVEHGATGNIATFDDFIKDASKYIQKIFE